MLRHHILLELLLISLLFLKGVLIDLGLQGFLGLGLFRLQNRLFLVISETFRSKIGPFVIDRLLMLVVFDHLIEMVVIDQLFAILLLHVSLCLPLYFRICQFLLDRLSELFSLLFLVDLADGDLFFVAKQCLFHAIFHGLLV